MDETRRFSVQDITRLLQLVAGAADDRGLTSPEVIDGLFQRDELTYSTQSRLNRFTAEFADQMRRNRLKRNELVGAGLFRDPAWDMMLDLFTADERGQRLSVSALCHGSGVPITTGLRYIQRLEANGLLTREGDLKDNRRCSIRATPKAIEVVAFSVNQLIDNLLAMHQKFCTQT